MRKEVNEIYWIRALACLSVVALHVITTAISQFSPLPESTVSFLKGTQLMLLAATPIFILISELLLSYAYPDKLPAGFFKKRIKFVLIPYIAVGIVYALYDMVIVGFTFEGFIWKIVNMLLVVKWHGYFILIIFQFYILHALLTGYLKKIPPFVSLLAAAVIQIGYTYVFLYVKAPEMEVAQLFWQSYSRILFPGWLFYFIVAWHVGRNFSKVKLFLQGRIKWVVFLLLLSAAAVFYQFFSGQFIAMSSRRLDILFYTVTLFFVLFYLFSKIERVPRAVMLISRYSFAIYLLHPLIKNIIHPWLAPLQLSLYLPVQFILTTGMCVFFAWLFSSWSVSKYVIGRVAPAKKRFTA